MIYKTINWGLLIWSIIRMLFPDRDELNNNYYFLFYILFVVVSLDKLVAIYFKENKNEQNN